MYDIIIVGAGPAGSTLARLLADQYKILIIDKRDLDHGYNASGPVKACGGLLAPDAQHMIAKLGLGVPKSVLVDPQLFTVRTIDLNRNLERYYQRFYFNMDREKFDRWLISLMPNTVEKRFNSVVKTLTGAESGYEVQYVNNGKSYKERGKVLVGADGGNSIVRRRMFKEKIFPRKYAAIQEWFTNHESMPYFTAIFDQEVSDFYSWIIPKGDAILLGAAIEPGSKANDKFEALKVSLGKYGFDLRHRIKREGAFIYRPKSTSHLISGKDHIALIGEAAGAISPSSAEGFSYAFKSAAFLAESLEPRLEGFLERYNRRLVKLKANILIKNLKSPAMYHPFLRNLAMGSGLNSMDIKIK